MQMENVDSYQPITINPKNKIWLLICLIFLGIGVILLLSYPTLRLPYIYQINYNEGWNVYHDREAITGQALYSNPTSDPFTPVNYPPISFYIVGLAGYITGNYLIAGRVISLVSMLLFSMTGILILRISGIKNVPAIFGGLAILAFFTSYAQEYVGMNDPQMLAHAITMAGLLVYVIRGKTMRGLAVTALLLNIGLFTKHNIIPITAAVTLDVFIRSRSRFFTWIGFFTISFAVLFAFFSIQSGGYFLDQLLINRGYKFSAILEQLHKLDLAFLFTALVAGWTALTLLTERKLRIFALYLGFSILVGAYFSGGSGTNINMFFDLFISIGLLLGICLHRLQIFMLQIPVIHKTTFWLLPPLLVFGLLFRLPNQIPKSNSQHLLQLFQDNFLQDAEYLKNVPGRAFCENMLLCFTAGKQLEIDPFMASEMAITGSLDEKLILRMFETRQFTMIQLRAELTKSDLNADKYIRTLRSSSITRNMRIAIGKNYVKDKRVSSGFFYKVQK
jgi:hypothetical protein